MLNVTADILHGAIRIAGVMTPVGLFVGLPLAIALRALVRRRRALAG
jgi:ABC-type spermidine/putrescine transport system permease subunit I